MAILWLGTAGNLQGPLVLVGRRMPQSPRSQPEMTQIDPVRVTLRLPRDLARDVIVRHALSAREWQQLPFDALQSPVEIENLDGSRETTEAITHMLPKLLHSILGMVGDSGWSARYDKETAVSVAGAICAYALESGVRLTSPTPNSMRPRITPMPRMKQWLN